MKTIKIIQIATLIIISAFSQNQIHAQTINWNIFSPDLRHILNVNTGYDFGFTFGIGYGYQIKSKLPLAFTAEYSQPAGTTIFDDFKTKVGGQIRLFQMDQFQISARVQGVFRRYDNSYVRMLNFGSDLSLVAGYYKPKWFVAGEVGFDKAIITHFKHSSQSIADYPDIKGGWYKPTTGGNFYFGMQTGISFAKNDITLRGGVVIQQDFKTSPTVPYYLQIGYNRRF